MINDEYTREDELDENKNDNVEAEEADETTHEAEEESTNSEETDWKAEALKYKAILDRNKEKPKSKESRKSDEFGYDVMAYLKASGITEKEFDFVKAELKNSSGIKDYSSLISNEYFQAKLEKHRALSKTENAVPKGSRSGGTATDSVEYYASKPIEEVPREMRFKVIQHKLAKEGGGKEKFYNS